MYKSIEWKYISFPFRNIYSTCYLSFFLYCIQCVLVTPSLYSSPGCLSKSYSQLVISHQCTGVGHSPPTRQHPQPQRAVKCSSVRVGPCQPLPIPTPLDQLSSSCVDPGEASSTCLFSEAFTFLREGSQMLQIFNNYKSIKSRKGGFFRLSSMLHPELYSRRCLGVE